MAKSKITEEAYEKPRKQAASSGRYNLNIVPLIDVLFLLLLFFILGSHFKVAEGQIPGALPRSEGQGTAAQQKVALPPLTIRITPTPDSFNAVYESDQSQRQMSADDLYNFLSKAYETNKANDPDWPLIIKPLTLGATPKSPHGAMVRWEHIVEVYNQAARAGFKTIGFDQSGG